MSASLSECRAWRAAAPGVALAIGLAITAKLASEGLGDSLLSGRFPVSPVLLGILLGMLWNQFVGVGSAAAHGVQWMLGTVLRIGIALVGLRLTLHGMAEAGAIAIPVVAACIATALLVSRIVGRMLGLSSGLQQLLAVGSAVCGCTAIVATAPAIRARPLETSTALACVVLIGSLGMMLYPWLGALVFDSDPLPVGVFLGSAIHDTSQVIGASLIAAQQFGAPDVIGVASATKLFRNLAIIVLVPAMAWMSRKRPAPDDIAGMNTEEEPIVPAFVLWFVALVLVRAAGDQAFAAAAHLQHLWAQAMSVSQTVSELLMIGGMTAVGLSLSLAQMRAVGPKPLCAALLIACATAACSLALTRLLFTASM